MLAYKSAEDGGIYTESPTRKVKTTQRCAKCWQLTQMVHNEEVKDVECQEILGDEMWSFIKKAHRLR